MRVLLTGATGYVGGRLLPVLEARDHVVHCIARRPEYLASRVGPKTRIFEGDVLRRETLAPACAGAQVAYYLVHSLGESAGFEERERVGAQHFAEAARAAGVERIVYLGGLGGGRGDLSPHLRSRHRVGRVLRESGVPTIELRASIVIGSGSLSFEMIRSLTEHLPLMITPRWVSVLAQPIAIQDLLDYLVQAIDLPLEESLVVEVGGADRLSYRDLMREYARQRGLKRLMIPVPVLTPRLSSLWLGLVTPLYARVGRKLVESIRHPTVVTDDLARTLFDIRPRGAREAIRSALQNEDRHFAETRWSDSLSASGTPSGFGGRRFGGRLIDARSIRVEAPAESAFHVVERVGGAGGWFAYDFLWRLRGALDLFLGGVGMRRGRPADRELRVGDALDFWRVDALERPRRLRLLAEMKLPGRAWLEFAVEPDGTGSIVRQTAVFDPIGLSGLVYWYLLYPAHALVFRGMVRGVGRRIAGRPRRGRLAPCPSTPNCVSSDDPDDAHRIEPFRLPGDPASAWHAAAEVVGGMPRTRVVERTGEHLHAECRTALLGFVDDLDLQLRPAERLIAVRSASRRGYSDLGVNRRRVERLRAALRRRGVIE